MNDLGAQRAAIILPEGEDLLKCAREGCNVLQDLKLQGLRPNGPRFCCGAPLDSNTDAQNLTAPPAASAG
jgi:hypothetical protein